MAAVKVIHAWYFLCILELGDFREDFVKDVKCEQLAVFPGRKTAWNLDDKDEAATTCGIGEAAEFWLFMKNIKLNTFADVIYVDVEAKLTLCFNPDSDSVTCYSNNFEMYIYRGEYIKGLSLNTGLHNLLNDFSPVYNITNNTSPNATLSKSTQTLSFYKNNSQNVTFAIRSRGACGKIFRIKVYYYECEETFINLQYFEKTTSPGNGSIYVIPNCSLNSLPIENTTKSEGLCNSNGTWTMITDWKSKCLCIEGYQHNKRMGCLPCPPAKFKPDLSNLNCTNCPGNTQPTSNRSTCLCVNGYYKSPYDQTVLSPCYALLMPVGEPTICIDHNSVTLSWDEPLKKDSLDEEIFYDVVCFSCKETTCNTSCVKEQYNVGRQNFSQTSVEVSNLKDFECYKFRIFQKNSLNDQVPKEKWNFLETSRVCITNKEKNISQCIKPTVSAGNTKGNKGENTSFLVAVVMAMGLILIILIVILGVFCKKIFWRKKKQTNTQVEDLQRGKDVSEESPYSEIDDVQNSAGASTVLTTFGKINRSDDAFWEFPRDRVVTLRKLGEGSFGEVNKAKLLPFHSMTLIKGGIVAVKTLKENTTVQDRHDFLNELNLMKKLEPHPYVVQLLGCCTLTDPYFLILEYLVGGDLLGYLRKSRGYEDPYNSGEYIPKARLSEKNLLSFAWMISDGMNYLAENKIVHRDLAARNVPVGDHNICKVSDFGLAREGTYERKSKARLPVKWMAPEDILHGKCTSMSDMWSYGILLWEIFTIGDSPYPGYKAKDVLRLVETGYRMSKPMHLSDNVFSIMTQCWDDEPEKRPKFSEVKTFFQEMFNEDSKVCLDLSKFEDHHYMNFDKV